MIQLADLEGHRFGVTHAGDVWIDLEVWGDEPVALWQLLEAHAAGWRAIEGSRKRLPAHRLKVCPSCGSPCLAMPSTTRCRCCRSTRKLAEVRMVWAGEE